MTPDPFAWIPEWVVKVVFGLVAFANYLFWRDVARERRSIDEKLTTLSMEIGRLSQDMKDRFAREGEKTSKLASYVQGLSGDLRKEWREDFDIMMDNHRRR